MQHLSQKNSGQRRESFLQVLVQGGLEGDGAVTLVHVQLLEHGVLRYRIHREGILLQS